MKLRKRVVLVTGTVSILCAILLFLTCGVVYDIILAVFGSSLVTCVVEIIEYFNVRKESMERYYQWGIRYLNGLNRIKFNSNIYDVEKLEAEDLINTYKPIKEFHNIDIDEFGNIFAQFDFFFANETIRKNIIADIYKIVISIMQDVSLIDYHFKRLENGEGNKNVCANYLRWFYSRNFYAKICRFNTMKSTSVYFKTADTLDSQLEKLRCEIVFEKNNAIDSDIKPVLISNEYDANE